jgi:RNA polymerase sigma-70 factor (ECF subfamily)
VIAITPAFFLLFMSDDIDIDSLVASCQAGTLEDFDPIYRAYVKQIYGFTYRRTLNRETAEDLTSITFMKALEKIGSYKSGKGAFGAWLFRIARNTITDHYRTNRPVTNIEDVWDLASDDATDVTVEHRLAYEQIKEALQKLSSDKRDIVMMRLWDGLSYKEIAAITGKTETNCKVIFSRTLEVLRTETALAAFILLLLSPFKL